MVLMLVCTGLVVDVGHAMLVQRQLQAGVDSAALAGVQHLPDATAAQTAAMQYSATPGSKNAVNTVDNAVTTATVSCLPGVPGCTRRDGGVNGIKVRSVSSVPTWFGRVIGINHLKVSAQATACAPCNIKPLDIMIVVDRTGSMCQTRDASGNSHNDPACTDLNNAKEGVRTFLRFLDPQLDKVGLAVLPPVRSPQFYGSRCPFTPWQNTGNPNPPPASLDGKYFGYDSFWPDLGSPGPPPRPGYQQLPGWAAEGRVWQKLGGNSSNDPSRYVVASLEGADGILSDDYIVENPTTHDWDLNPASNLVQRLGCEQGAGSTHYALALEEAQYELERNGRGNVQNVIIFLSDGAANTTPMNLPTGHWLNNSSAVARPCGTGVESAAWAKGRGTVIYTIGYDLDGATPGVAETCKKANSSNGHQGTVNESCQYWGCNAYDAIRAIATSPAHFYNKPEPGDLGHIFTQIAIDLAGSRGRLIDDTAPNLLG